MKEQGCSNVKLCVANAVSIERQGAAFNSQQAEQHIQYSLYHLLGIK